MTRNEAVKFIETGLLEGKSKMDLYHELKSNFKFKIDLNQCLAKVPELSLREKYKKLNLFLASVLLFFGLVQLIIKILIITSISPFLIPVILFIPVASFCLAYNILNFNGKIYSTTYLLGTILVLNSLSKSSTETFTSLDLVLCYLPLLIIILISHYIKSKVFPYYGFWGQLKENEIY